MYKDVLHYWSFDDPENLMDLKTGVRSINIKTTVSYESGPINLAMLTNPEVYSGLRLGQIKYPCLKDASLCPGGLTISAWIKQNDPRNRESYFTTYPSSSRVGIALVSYADRSEILSVVQGTKHKCSLDLPPPSYRLWMFASLTWIVQQDGTGKLVFYLIHGTGFNKIEKICRELILSMEPTKDRMEIKLQRSYSNSGFSIDELVIWNSSLTEDRIMAMYDLVASKFCLGCIMKSIFLK